MLDGAEDDVTHGFEPLAEQAQGDALSKTGLVVKAKLDTRTTYPTGIEVSDDEMEGLNIARDKFHGEWNYLRTGNSARRMIK
jgi:hypothetical protein